MRIAIGSDHVGLELKSILFHYLDESGYEIVDYGPNSKERTDYPIFGQRVSKAVIKKKVDVGILICGTGVGMSLAANKIPGIRAVVCSEPYTAKLSREHNNTNVLALGSRVVGVEMAKFIVKEWLEASFESGRHQSRINMLEDDE